MQDQNFNITFQLEQSPEAVFAAVQNVRGWWSEGLEGDSEQLNDEFTYRHGDIHFSKHKLIEVVPNKRIVWLTLDSKLNFVAKQDEWNDTKVVFEITEQGDKTQLSVTHIGLVPECQCYEGCSKGWTHYLSGSLIPLIQTGKGKPDQKV